MSKPVTEALNEVAQTMEALSNATSQSYGEAAVRGASVGKAFKPVVDAQLAALIATGDVNHAVVGAEILAARSKHLGIPVDADVLKAETDRINARVAASDKATAAYEEARKAFEAARQTTNGKAKAALETLAAMAPPKAAPQKG